MTTERMDALVQGGREAVQVYLANRLSE
ncbi:hypothetical protein CCP3SC15_6570003 [Gammaproteobacteria bacterium]